MIRFLVKRIAFAVLVLWVISVVTFVVFVKLPAGDPARRAVGRAATAETLEQARTALGLDRPLYVQYGRFAKGLVPVPGWFLNKDVYYSYSTFIPVREEVARRLPVTAVLAAGAAVVWLVLGVGLGVFAAVRRGTGWDRSAMALAVLGISTPQFWIAYILLFVLWFKLGLAPPSGIPPDESVGEAVLNGRFVLPWLSLALAYAAIYARLVRGSLIQTFSEDYIRTARAKGVGPRRLLYHHASRPAMLPVATLLGLHIADLLGGAIIIETIFNLPGLGQYAVKSIFTNDFPAVMGVTVVASLFIVTANLIVDLVYTYIDPRIELR